jgi:large subunit ribosomal protein L24e
MVERRVCTFCGDEIEPGTGRMYIKKDGVIFNFCSSKCFKNLVVLGRVPRRTTWTRFYEREKQVRMKGIAETAQPTKARKLKKSEAKPKSEEEKEEEGLVSEPEAKEKPKEQKPKAEAKAAPEEKAGEKKPEPKKPSQKKSEAAKKEPSKQKSEEGSKQ